MTATISHPAPQSRNLPTGAVGRGISDYSLQSENNNLTGTRLILASAVIFSHCKLVATGSEEDLFTMLIGHQVSWLAVDGFFFLSGFLVYGSLARRPGVLNFLKARLFRVWPAMASLVFATVAIALFCGGRFGPETAQFVTHNLLLQSNQYRIDGIGVVNGSLWTISWEVRCYLALALLSLLGLTHPKSMMMVITASLVFAVIYHLTPFAAEDRGLGYYLAQLDRLWTAFALGIAAFIVRKHLQLSWALATLLVSLAILSHKLGLPLHLDAIAVGYVVLCLGFRTGSWTSRWSDYSYGMYLYAYPIMLLLAAAWPSPDYWSLSLANALATLGLAALSWHLVEHPALKLVRRRASGNHEKVGKRAGADEEAVEA